MSFTCNDTFAQHKSKEIREKMENHSTLNYGSPQHWMMMAVDPS